MNDVGWSVGIWQYYATFTQVTDAEKDEEVDEEVGVPYPNLLESMHNFQQGGVSICIYH